MKKLFLLKYNSHYLYLLNFIATKTPHIMTMIRIIFVLNSINSFLSDIAISKHEMGKNKSNDKNPGVLGCNYSCIIGKHKSSTSRRVNFESPCIDILPRQTVIS